MNTIGSRAGVAGRLRRTRLSLVAEARSVPRPHEVETFYVEQGFDSLGTEQLHLHAAEGEQAAAAASTTAATWETARVESVHLVKVNRPLVDAALRRHVTVKELLSPLVVRKGSSAGYLMRTGALLVGDIAGLGGAAIAYGEHPTLALCQAASAGVATITAGLAGTQFKLYQLARQRNLEGDAAPQLKPYLPMLTGAGTSRGFLLAVTVVALIITLCIGSGIFALRSSIEGTASGFTFGLLALGIAAASWINSYSHADPVADAITAARRDYTNEQRRHRRLSRSLWLVRADRASEQSSAIRREHRERGQAAIAHLQALKYETLNLNPDVVGHGYESSPPAVLRAIKGKRL
ncbi:hypothetical protein V7968_16330 [Nocardia vulneris]|uniref:hypothetical protein n=1 Tax=Nocardia vulneris TaxID=1141657 RepID=UPI0030CB5044